MRRKVCWGSICLLLFFLCFVLTPSIVQATGWVSEVIGQENAVFNFEQYPLENYSLDFYVDTSWNWLPWKWGEGIGDAVIYGLYAITNVLWLLNVYISYFIGFIVQEAFDLDFITNLISNLATNMQRIAGIDRNGLRATGLFPIYGKWVVLIAGCYIAYVAGVKRQTTRAIQHMVLFFVTFILSGVFMMNANHYLTQVNNAQKDINSEILVIAKSIIPNSSTERNINPSSALNSGEQETKSATNAIRENLFELQVSTPWRLLQFGDSDVDAIGEKRINDLLSQSQFTDKSNREDVVKMEVEKHNNMNMSLNGAFLRFGMTLLAIVSNTVISYSVAVLTITMITSQILFLLFCAFLPVAMVFSLFPNSNRLILSAMQKVAQALMTKMGITLILAIIFSLSHSFFSLSAEKGYIWVIFLQIAVWLTTVNKVNELLGFMRLGGADTQPAGRFGRMTRNLMLAGVARNMIKRTPIQPKQLTANTQQKNNLSVNKASKPPISRTMGEKISTIQDMPKSFVEKASNVKDAVKNTPTTAKYKALQIRNNYDDGRIGTEIKNNEQRSKRVAQRQLTQQQRIDALKQMEERKKNNVRNELASTVIQGFDQTKLPKEKNVLRPTVSQADKKRRVSVPVAKTSFNSVSTDRVKTVNSSLKNRRPESETDSPLKKEAKTVTASIDFSELNSKEKANTAETTNAKKMKYNEQAKGGIKKKEFIQQKKKQKIKRGKPK